MFRSYIYILFFLVITSCGSVSKVIVTSGSDIKSDKLQNKNYEVIIVDKFELADDFKTSLVNKNKKQDLTEDYADRVYSNLFIKASSRGIRVYRTGRKFRIGKKKAIILSGVIKKYDDGNSLLRGLVGFGAGRAKFNSDVVLKDFKNKKELGIIEVRKGSWLLGGYIAMTHDASELMNMSLDDVSNNVLEAIKENQ